MARTTRIIRWRNRRQRMRASQGHGVRRGLVVLAIYSLFGLILLLMTVLIGVTLAYGRITRDLPDYEALVATWEQKVASGNGHSQIFAWTDKQQVDVVLIYEFEDPLKGERRWLSVEQMPQALIDATIAVEDPTLVTGPEIGFEAIAGAISDRMLKRDPVQGRIPLVQQVVSGEIRANAQEGFDESRNPLGFQAWLTELLLAHRASRTYDSHQIVEWFLNTAYYGNLAFGAEAAARVYFDKPLEAINLAEAAMLATIPAEPSLNPLDNAVESKRRQEQALEQMAAEGMISQDALAAARFAPLQFAPFLEERFDIIAPHFALFVRRELEARFGAERLLTGGLSIYTTLNLEMQRQAECVARAHTNRLSGHIGADLPADERESCHALGFLQPPPPPDNGLERDVDNAAVIVMDSETAGIRAMVGSLNYWDSRIAGSVNSAVDVQHQPAAAFYPFIYLTALSQGYTASTMVLDVESEFDSANGTTYVPQNEDGRYRGPLRLREALGNGYHVPAVQVMSWVGVDRVLRTAHALGITGLVQGAHSYGLSLAREGGEVSLLDLVYAYSVMNNMGQMLGQARLQPPVSPGERTLDPVAILRVEDMNGELLFANETPRRREILTPQLAYLMNDMLSDRSARCAYFGCPNIMELPDNRPAAVTIGTSGDLRDSWAIGYTPQLIAGVWLGNSDGETMRELSADIGAAPIWRALMSWAMSGEPVAVWTQPPNLTELAVCNISGLLATAYCPAISELFIAGTQPTVYDTIYQEFAINRETNRLATIDTPPDLVEHKIYTIYPEGASEWALENDIDHPPTEYDTISGISTGEEGVQISWPPPFAFVNNEVAVKGSAFGPLFDYYRLAYFKGLNPTDVEIISQETNESGKDETLGVWDITELDGLYTLLLTVVRTDGSFSEVSVPLTVDNVPPELTIQSPLPGQVFSANTTSIPIRVRTSDNISVAQVRFYLDDNESAFATSLSSPFSASWNARSSGCYILKAVAADEAGNEVESGELPLCISTEPGD